MGWGEKAIEIRSVETGHLDGVFMHKRAQRLKFLCERNDKVRMKCFFNLAYYKIVALSLVIGTLVLLFGIGIFCFPQTIFFLLLFF